MIKRLLSVGALALMLKATANAQTINKARLDSLMDILSSNNKTMGSLAVSQNGKIIYQRAVGYAAVDSLGNPAINTKTKFRIGSISKTFTSVIIMQLVEEGKLTLDTKLSKFYPQMPNADKITMTMLLNHHSGLFNLTNTPEFESYMLTPQTHEQLVSKMAALKPDFEPGTKYKYSNTNFILLAYIAEKVSGKAYPELVKQRVVNKIGLKDTYYGGKINVGANEALPYSYNGKKWVLNPQSDMSIPSGAGAMVSTPADLDKFIEALFAGKLVSKASLDKMLPATDNYGLGIHKIINGDKVGYGHGGAIDSYRSILSYYPQDKLAIAYTESGGTYAPETVEQSVFQVYFNKPFKLPNYAKVAATGLEKYTGIYASPALPIKITISKDNGALVAQATGQSAFPLDATATADTFAFEPAGIEMVFRPEKGEFTLKQGGGQFVFTKEKQSKRL
ncbi:beta-lactamase family protein [Mucilaginibacter pallidiroseus]|uniref:Beta-lactamase family protein n=1 Tax=Mucilaginibacter pallidiroseus TaxID=2599295 RepID=A0A563U399_9SPHI|nr:serine hydrolase domain-containing protein [Mucilaginibacter pallidiroseus]TWR25821.1 beta-lactamase family protein [Mucilaginibacter pallidiroseus]